jgi:hypothetical protein
MVIKSKGLRFALFGLIGGGFGFLLSWLYIQFGST